MTSHEIADLIKEIDLLLREAPEQDDREKAKSLIRARALLCQLLETILPRLKTATAATLLECDADPYAQPALYLGNYLKNEKFSVFADRQTFEIMIKNMITLYESKTKSGGHQFSKILSDQYDYMLKTYLGMPDFEMSFSYLAELICRGNPKKSGYHLPWWLVINIALLLGMAADSLDIVEKVFPEKKPEITIVEPATDPKMHLLTIALSLCVIVRWIQNGEIEMEKNLHIYPGITVFA